MILGNITRFLKALTSLNMPVTRKATTDLVKLQKRLSQLPQDSKLIGDDAKKLREIIKVLRPTFTAEAQCQYIFTTSPKRIDLDKLLNNVPSLFALQVFESLSDISKTDFCEAGKCTAFERPTAAAFHLMRATEAVVRLYYKKYIRPAKADLTWGQMTTALRQKTNSKKPNTDTLAHLDHIRTAFRNPTQHPEKIYSIDDVQDLFFLCIDATNRVVTEIK